MGVEATSEPNRMAFTATLCPPAGMECTECALLASHLAAVFAACGNTSGGESLETMVPKACGI